MSTCFEETIKHLGWQSSGDCFDDNANRALLSYASAFHDTNESDVLSNPASESLRRLKPHVDALTFSRLRDRLEYTEARLDRQ